MDQSLQAELEQSIERQSRGEAFVPPESVTILGFVRSGSEPDSNIPEAIAGLPPGKHNATIDNIDYRVLIADNGAERYFLLFNTDLQHEREQQLKLYLWFIAVLMVLLSTLSGFWLALGMVNPLTRLAKQVAMSKGDEIRFSLDKLSRDDEVGELARAFEHYVQRLKLFVEREKNFTADISHELRTPLAVILGAIEVLEHDSNLTEKQTQRIARIKRAVLETKELSGALLALAREPEKLDEQHSYAVSDVLSDCVEKHRYLMEGNPVQLQMEINGNPRVGADRALLEVVIGNLIRNAFSYTRTGSVRVVLDATRLQIIDTGIGMHSEELTKIFDLHYRGATSSGAGIGLSLVKRICERFGWEISMTSQPGQGTTAEVVFRSATI